MFILFRKITSHGFFNNYRATYRLFTLISQNNVGIKLSDSCVKRLKEICNDGSFLRVIVEGGGCSGFQYKFNIDTIVDKDDLTFGTPDARVVVDTTSMSYIDGSTVDYHKELIRAGFRIVNNARADHGCSCGASFSLKFDKQ